MFSGGGDKYTPAERDRNLLPLVEVVELPVGCGCSCFCTEDILDDTMFLLLPTRWLLLLVLLELELVVLVTTRVATGFNPG